MRARQRKKQPCQTLIASSGSNGAFVKLGSDGAFDVSVHVCVHAAITPCEDAPALRSNALINCHFSLIARTCMHAQSVTWWSKVV